MQYRLVLPDNPPPADVLADALISFDPAALTDYDQATHVLRVSTFLNPDNLFRALSQAGLTLRSASLEIVPSECCGGCGG